MASVCDLIRREQARARLRDLVIEGMTSGSGSDLDAVHFKQLRERICNADDGAA